MSVRRLAVANGPNIFQMLLVLALQLLQSGIFYLQRSECVSALTPSAISPLPQNPPFPSGLLAHLAPSSCASESASAAAHRVRLQIIFTYLLLRPIPLSARRSLISESCDSTKTQISLIHCRTCFRSQPRGAARILL